jgi:hypothetical protein
METPILDRPLPESSAPWPLSAPESYVLLHGPRARGVEAFKRGLLELVDLRRSARVLGTPLRDFTCWSVLPALMERGLYERDDYAAPAAISKREIHRDHGRRAARIRLESLLKSADREFSPAARRDPGEALALAGGLGSAILLMDPLLSEIAWLGQRIRDGVGDIAMTGRSELNTSSIDLDAFDLGWLGKLDGVFNAVGDMGSGDSGGGDWGWSDGDGGSGWGDGDSGGGWGDGDGGGGWGDSGGGGD